jgi:ELWxxDGT repeat protein
MLSLTPQLVADLEIGLSGRGLLATAVAGDELYFVNSSTTSRGAETQGLWKTDGTPQGTVHLADVDGQYGCSAPQVVNVDDTVYFHVDPAEGGWQWWQSDGTVEGTVRASQPASLEYDEDLHNDEIEIDGTMYSLDWVPSRDRGELWKTDGTPAGTESLTHHLQVAGSHISHLTAVGDDLFFVMDDGVSGKELWKSDGTVEGTVQVRDIMPGPEASSPKYLTNVNGTLFFNAEDIEGNNQLWRSDGTAEGTVQLTDFDNATEWWRMGPRNMVAIGRTLFFTSRDGDAGVRLWKTDPPPGDTNYDGIVDLVDFQRLKETMGEVGVRLAADFNQDGTVDAVDFAILEGNFGFGIEDGTVHTADQPLWQMLLDETTDGVLLPQAGDANLDRQFDQLDWVTVLQAGKYDTSLPAIFEEGDFNHDGWFDQLDIVAALQTGNYLRGPYATRD